jgi:hypothetical protein
VNNKAAPAAAKKSRTGRERGRNKKPETAALPATIRTMAARQAVATEVHGA